MFRFILVLIFYELARFYIYVIINNINQISIFILYSIFMTKKIIGIKEVLKNYNHFFFDLDGVLVLVSFKLVERRPRCTWIYRCS